MQFDENSITHRWIGVQINELQELENLIVRTKNTTYEITIICGQKGHVLVRGGLFFPEGTEVCLSGASVGESLLKLRGIYVGLSMEFHHDGRRIRTSTVDHIQFP